MDRARRGLRSRTAATARHQLLPSHPAVPARASPRRAYRRPRLPHRYLPGGPRRLQLSLAGVAKFCTALWVLPSKLRCIDGQSEVVLGRAERRRARRGESCAGDCADRLLSPTLPDGRAPIARLRAKGNRRSSTASSATTHGCRSAAALNLHRPVSSVRLRWRMGAARYVVGLGSDKERRLSG